jgi:hyperosmotically inducible periplasmic protein
MSDLSYNRTQEPPAAARHSLSRVTCKRRGEETMKIMKRNYVAALIAAASMSVVAGNAFADDVKSDQPVKDSYITTKVKAELAKDKGTKAHEIHVTTKNGIVMLEGTVSSEAEKELAAKDARKVKGVVDVKNGLSVQ